VSNDQFIMSVAGAKRPNGPARLHVRFRKSSGSHRRLAARPIGRWWPTAVVWIADGHRQWSQSPSCSDIAGGLHRPELVIDGGYMAW